MPRGGLVHRGIFTLLMAGLVDSTPSIGCAPHGDGATKEGLFELFGNWKAVEFVGCSVAGRFAAFYQIRHLLLVERSPL